MKIKILCFLILLSILISCKGPTTPETPKAPEVPYVPPKKADIVLDGDLIKTMKFYIGLSYPQFEGYVKNIGNNAAYNCRVEIKCYSDIDKITILDTAYGYTSSDINPGQRTSFAAIAYKCISHEQIKSYDVKITWLDRS